MSEAERAEFEKLQKDFKQTLQFITRMDSELQECRRLLNKHAQQIDELENEVGDLTMMVDR